MSRILKVVPLILAGMVGGVGCGVDKLGNLPSWDVEVKFPVGDTAVSVYGISRYLMGSDSTRVIRIDPDIYWKVVGISKNDTLVTPDSVIAVIYANVNRPKFVKRGMNGLVFRDMFMITKLFIDTAKSDVQILLRALVNFRESGIVDTFELNSFIPANSTYFEDTIDGLYIRAESTVIYLEAYGYSDYVGDALILDSAKMEVYIPFHMEAYDTFIVDGLLDFGLQDSLTFGNSSITSMSIHLFSKRSVPIQFTLEAWLKDTVTNADSMLVARVDLPSPPKDANGYSIGFAYDTLVLGIDTAGIRFINEHLGKVKLRISGMIPGNPVNPFKAYVKADDSLSIWGYANIEYFVNNAGGGQ